MTATMLSKFGPLISLSAAATFMTGTPAYAQIANTASSTTALGSALQPPGAPGQMLNHTPFNNLQATNTVLTTTDTNPTHLPAAIPVDKGLTDIAQASLPYISSNTANKVLVGVRLVNVLGNVFRYDQYEKTNSDAYHPVAFGVPMTAYYDSQTGNYSFRSAQSDKPGSIGTIRDIEYDKSSDTFVMNGDSPNGGLYITTLRGAHSRNSVLDVEAVEPTPTGNNNALSPQTIAAGSLLAINDVNKSMQSFVSKRHRQDVFAPTVGRVIIGRADADPQHLETARWVLYNRVTEKLKPTLTAVAFNAPTPVAPVQLASAPTPRQIVATPAEMAAANDSIVKAIAVANERHATTREEQAAIDSAAAGQRAEQLASNSSIRIIDIPASNVALAATQRIAPPAQLASVSGTAAVAPVSAQRTPPATVNVAFTTPLQTAPLAQLDSRLEASRALMNSSGVLPLTQNQTPNLGAANLSFASFETLKKLPLLPTIPAEHHKNLGDHIKAIWKAVFGSHDNNRKPKRAPADPTAMTSTDTPKKSNTRARNPEGNSDDARLRLRRDHTRSTLTAASAAALDSTQTAPEDFVISPELAKVFGVLANQNNFTAANTNTFSKDKLLSGAANVARFSVAVVNGIYQNKTTIALSALTGFGVKFAFGFVAAHLTIPVAGTVLITASAGLAANAAAKVVAAAYQEMKKNKGQRFTEGWAKSALQESAAVIAYKNIRKFSQAENWNKQAAKESLTLKNTLAAVAAVGAFVVGIEGIAHLFHHAAAAATLPTSGAPSVPHGVAVPTGHSTSIVAHASTHAQTASEAPVNATQHLQQLLAANHIGGEHMALNNLHSYAVMRDAIANMHHAGNDTVARQIDSLASEIFKQQHFHSAAAVRLGDVLQSNLNVLTPG